MREVNQQDKIQADSLVEIKRGYRAEADRLTDMGIKWNDHVPRPGNVMNFVASAYLHMTVEQRDAIIREGMKCLAAHLKSDKPIPLPAKP